MSDEPINPKYSIKEKNLYVGHAIITEDGKEHVIIYGEADAQRVCDAWNKDDGKTAKENVVKSVYEARQKKE